MPRGPSAPPPLGVLEALVMDELWDRGPLSVRSTLDAVNARDWRQRRYTTVLTVMSRLEGKGLLRRTRDGRRDVYEPTLARERYQEARAAAEAGAMVDEYGDVALAHFARHLKGLDPKRRAQIRRMARDD
jgi:predicted transcriptional regulator